MNLSIILKALLLTILSTPFVFASNNCVDNQIPESFLNSVEDILLSEYDLNLLPCFDKDVDPNELNSMEVASIEKDFKKHIKNNLVNTTFTEYISSNAYKLELTKLLTLARAHKKAKINELLAKEYLPFDGEQRGRLRGLVCEKIDAVTLNSDYPFTRSKFKLFADEAKTVPAVITVDEFKSVKEEILKSAGSPEDYENVLDQSNALWMMNCEPDIRPDVLAKAKRNNTVGSIEFSSLNCLSPNYQITTDQLMSVPAKKNKPSIVVYKTTGGSNNKLKNGSMKCFFGKDKKTSRTNIEFDWLTGKSLTSIDVNRKVNTKNSSSKATKTLYGSIGGNVTCSLTMESIDGVKVLIESKPTLSALSSGNEGYKIENIELINKNKNLLATHRKYEPAKLKIDQMIPSEMVFKYHFILEPKKTNLRGKIVDENGTAIGYEPFKVVATLKLKSGEIFSKTFEARTKEDGTYEILQIPAIYDRVQVFFSSNAFESTAVESMDLNPDIDWNGKDLSVVRKFLTIEGRVLDSKTKEVISDATLISPNLKLKEGEALSGRSLADGSYKLSDDNHPFPIRVGDGLVVKVDSNRTSKSGKKIYQEKLVDEKVLDFTQAGRNQFDESSHSTAGFVAYETNGKDILLKPIITDIEGHVIHKQSGRKMANADVSLIQNGIVVDTRKSDENGFYQFRFVDEGTYGLEAKVNGYTDGKTQVTHTHAQDTIADIKVSRIDLTGMVKDQNGSTISNALVVLNIAGKSFTTTSDQRGQFRIDNIPEVSNGTLVGSKTQYITNTKNIETEEKDLVVDLVLLELSYTRNRIVIVLTWGDRPADLDSQLVNGNYLLNWKNLGDSRNSLTNPVGPRAVLDTDDTSGRGPETTIIQLSSDNRVLVTAPYNFMVHDYSNFYGSTMFKDATVEVYKHDQKVNTFELNNVAVKNDSSLWHVFDVINGNVVPVMQLKFKEEYTEVGRLTEDNKNIKANIDLKIEELAKFNELKAQYEKLKENQQTYLKDLKELVGPYMEELLDPNTDLSVHELLLSDSNIHSDSAIQRTTTVNSRSSTNLRRFNNSTTMSVLGNLNWDKANLVKSLTNPSPQSVRDIENRIAKIGREIESMKDDPSKANEVDSLKLSMQLLERAKASYNDRNALTQLITEVDRQIETAKGRVRDLLKNRKDDIAKISELERNPELTSEVPQQDKVRAIEREIQEMRNKIQENDGKIEEQFNLIKTKLRGMV